MGLVRASACLALLSLAVTADAAITGAWTIKVPATSGATASVLGVTVDWTGASANPYTNATFNPTNFWSDPYGATINGQPSLEAGMSPFGTPRTVTVTFSEPVTNPVLHVDRIGATVNQFLVGLVTNTSIWTLSGSTPAGVTLTRLAGNAQFDVTATSFQRDPVGVLVLFGGGECSAAASAAACGSVRFNGTGITSLTFAVTWAGLSNGATGDDIEFIWSIPQTQVVVQKVSAGATGVFPFTGTNGVGSFSLDTGAANPATSATFNVASYANPITITETDGAFALSSTSCTGSVTGAVTSSLAGETLTIGTANYSAVDQVITCVFTNTISTAAGVNGFRAVTDGGAVGVEWRTAWERGTIGFDVFRRDEKTGRYVAVNDRLVPGALVSQRGSHYRVVDRSAKPGQALTYVLREKEATGDGRFYGPYTVMPEPAAKAAEGFEPLAPRLGPKRVQRATRQAGTEYVEILRAPRPPAAPLAPSGPVYTKARVLVEREGLHFVSVEQLALALGQPAATLRQRLSSGALRLREQGQPVAWTRDAAGTGLYFFGRSIDSAFTRNNVYQLDLAAGNPMGSAVTALASPIVGQSFLSTVHAEEDRLAAVFAGGDPDGDYWFWGLASSGSEPSSFTVPTPGSTSTGIAKLAVQFRGGGSGFDTGRHHAVVRIGGVSVGEASWDGLTDFRLETEFDASLLQDGANQVEVEAVLDPGYTFSFFLVDSVDISYPRAYRAVGDVLRVRADGNPTVTIGGFSSSLIGVFDLSNPRQPRAVTSARVTGAQQDFRVSFTPASPDREYLAVAFPAGRVATVVEGDADSNLKATSNAARYLILTPASLRAGADALANYRRARFQQRMVVDVQDVYDEFSYGLEDPRSIRTFLAYASSSWSGRPAYAVLVGKGTIDPKNHGGFGTNLFPVLSVSTPTGLYASDSRYADFKGNDGIPDVALGRIPALSVADVTAYVNKLRAYETESGAWTSRAVFLADNPDGGGDFTADSNEVAAHVATALTADKIHHVSDVADTRQRFFQSFAQGASVFHYTGHASIDYLAEEQLVTAADAAALTNGAGSPVFVGLTCIVGDGTLPGSDSLAEALLWKSGGGISASFAPTGQSLDAYARVLGTGVYDRLFAPGSTRILGDAVRGSLTALASTSAPRHMREIYQILGDPALKVRR